MQVLALPADLFVHRATDGRTGRQVFRHRQYGHLVWQVMLTHQLAGFLGAWLGGRVFEATGNYNWVWYIDIVLALGAALIHLPIQEAKVMAHKKKG